ncbi:MAG: RrF2 family transcriptional regulator [Eubacterium sp.]|uniref:RrF2 family transcriptional regulator n=1 Tax=Eubacterium sp. TaxID=142586 RepID=UPI003991BF68
MMISTKGRYALRVMIDLAQNSKDNYVSLKDVAKRQNISMKYLEMIVSMLNKGNMVKSLRGKSGGYKLAKIQRLYGRFYFKIDRKTLAPVMYRRRTGTL